MSLTGGRNKNRIHLFLRLRTNSVNNDGELMAQYGRTFDDKLQKTF